ncbi:MAG: hypothetical protein QXW91_06095 [Candidatus Nitrosotenuis sp.]
MRESDRFEIERAYDLLPHVVGASWASIYFRLHQIRKPTEVEFRAKVAEYFGMLKNMDECFPEDENFSPIRAYIKGRFDEEVLKILEGKNLEVEKRYKRYIDYG